MSSEDQKFFEDCRSLFLTDGWKHFQKEIGVAIQALTLAPSTRPTSSGKLKVALKRCCKSPVGKTLC